MTASDAPLSPADWLVVRQTFDAAQAQAAPLAWLAQQDVSAAVRAQVARLLGSVGTTDGLLGRAPAHALLGEGDQRAVLGAQDPRALQVGARLGAWEITGLLGAGGMGEVYEARRADGAFEGVAAVKVLKTGLGLAAGAQGAGVLQRFAQEQQILASLNHPHIARLYDAGTTRANGQGFTPYFVMEKVDGQRIDHYVAGRPLHERLRVLLQLAEAVSYAHRNLAVHRDLKPSNVLVNAQGDVKLLDFGIAKAIDPTDHAPAPGMTQDDQRPLTPAYASPEQIRGERITTGTDVYALGVLFYVLLTGRHPYKTEPTSAYEAMQALISQTFSKPSAVPAPSLQAGTASAPAASPAITDPQWPRIRRALMDGLDWVVLKCLAKDPSQRYASVDALIADVRNAQAGKMVSAQAPSTWLLFAKFVARNRVAVAAASVGGLALVGATGAAVWQGHEATLAQAQTAQRLQDVKTLTRDVIFNYVDVVAYVPGGTEVRAKMLSELANQLDTVVKSAPDDLDLAADSALAHANLADIYRPGHSANLVDISKARLHANAAIALSERAKPVRFDDSRALALHSRAYAALADIARVEGNLPAARAAYESADRVLSAHPMLQSANWQNEIGSIQLGLSRIKDNGDTTPGLRDTTGALVALDKAEVAFRAAVVADKQVGQNKVGSVSSAMVGVVAGARGLLLLARDRFDEAEVAFDKSNALLQEQVDKNPNETRMKIALSSEANNAGYNHLAAGNWEKALASTSRTHAILDAVIAAEPKLEAHVKRSHGLKLHHGRALLANGDLVGALAALELARLRVASDLSARESIGDRRRLAFVLLAIGQTHAAAKRPELARAALEQAVEFSAAVTAADAKNRMAWVILADAQAGLAALAKPGDEADLQRLALNAFEAANRLQALGGQAKWRMLHAELRLDALSKPR